MCALEFELNLNSSLVKANGAAHLEMFSIVMDTFNKCNKIINELKERASVSVFLLHSTEYNTTRVSALVKQ